MVVVVPPALRLAPRLEDVEQHEEVQNSYHPEECAGDRRPDDCTDLAQLWKLFLHDRRSDDGRDRQTHYDGRMPKREEESDTQWSFSLLEKKAHGIVDSDDVIRIERVPQSEQVRGEAEPDERGVQRRIVKIKAPSDQMEGRDDPIKGPEPPTVRPSEGQSGGAWLRRLDTSVAGCSENRSGRVDRQLDRGSHDSSIARWRATID